ncbi:3-beta hydroxysteroid dehydrogenase [Devosia yakushimensis]|uniref:3-beta hydroxysteroid dehydrogenase n=1 Tax=Devosia yakushimensis TaxID=470028 RepID=A0ABQ5UI86_9HYPH|nr:SDR family oxidoreductase [Devosia yakushimensis]GLQ10316.1 3-beta hydroxysteroid dehydrogenase [Devosia yakushimensis]
MRVFVTGATGFVGTQVVRQLTANGHQIEGLARSDTSAAILEAAGIAVVRGDLTDLDTLASAARSADAVIHTGFIHDFSNFAASIAIDRRAVEAMGAALAGSGRPFIVTSGTGLMPSGQVSNEDTPATTTGHGALRGATEGIALMLVEQNVRVGIMRLPNSVHGDGDHGFVPMLIATARQKGVAGYVDDGANCWPAVHVTDAARAYLLALEHGEAGARHHAVAEQGVPFRDIAHMIGRRLSLPVTSIPREEAAAHFGWMANFASLDARASSQLTRERLGWEPSGPELLEDMENGRYFDD